MKHRGWRSIDEMKKIMAIQSVELLHPESDSMKLIKSSHLVFTVNGSASIEAAMYEKPSIILEDTGPFELPSMYKVNSLNELPMAIRKCLGEKVQRDDVIRYMNAVEKNSIIFEDQEILLRFHDLFYEGGFLANKELPEKEISLFLKHYKTSFDNFARLHIKSIKKKIE